MRSLALPLLPIVLLTTFLGAPVRAQEEEAEGPTTARDALLDDLLDRAAAKERLGDNDQAVQLYLELETALDKRRLKNPNDRPTTEVAEGVDRGVGLYIRDRIRNLPPEAQDLYRLTIDPRAKIALAAALESGEPEKIEGVIARYPLASSTGAALQALAHRALERGELGRAIRAYEQIGARAKRAGGDAGAALGRRAALRQLLTALLRRHGAQARAALAKYEAAGGDSGKVRSGSTQTLSARVAALPQGRVQKRKLPQGFDPGGISVSVPLPLPELPDELLQRLAAAPAYQESLLLGKRLLVADSKTVRSVRLKGGVGWTYSVQDPTSQVSRLEAAAWRPALGPGRVFATLHRNRPAKVTPAKKEGDPPVIERRKDWRVVALDSLKGELMWDAAHHPGFAQLARDAEWLSPPTFHGGGVYVVALTSKTDLRASLIRLDANSGKVVYRIFLASRTAYDFLGVGSPPPAPSVSTRGQVLVSTGLGALAAVDPSSGDVDWISRYPAVPRLSQGVLILAGRRFRPQSALSSQEPLLIAPVDSPDLLAVSSRDGSLSWRMPRGDAQYVLARDEHVFLVGKRLRIVSRVDGRLLIEGPEWRAPVSARPLLLGQELIAVTHSELLRISLADGSVLSRWRFAEPRRQGGAPVLLADGRVATVGYDAVHVFQPLTQRLRELKGLESGESELALGVLHARRGDARRALPLLRAAVRSGLTRTRALEAQRAGLLLMSDVASERGAADNFQGFRVAAEHAFAFLGPIGLRRERVLGRSQRELLREAAPLLVVYADELSGQEDPKMWPKAAQALQRLLSAPLGTRIHLGAGARVEASHYASIRLRELVAKHGPQVYAKFARQAKQALAVTRSAQDQPGLLAIIDRWPAAPAASSARWELAELFRRQGLARQSTDQLEAFLRDYPGHERVPEALARLALGYQATQRLAEAREVLEKLTDMEPEPKVCGEPSAPLQAARTWAQPLRATLYRQHRPESLAADRERRGLDLPIVEVYRSPTVLEMRGPHLVNVHAPHGMGGRALLRQGKTLDLVKMPEADLLLQIGDVPHVVNLEPCLLDEHLIVPRGDRLEAWDLSAQPPRRAWSRNFARGPGARIGPQPVHRIYAAKDTVVVLRGNNQVAGLDLKTGAQRWKRALPLQASGGLLVKDEVFVAVCTTPPSLAGLAVADGGLAWRHQPLSAPGRNPRLAVPRWLGSGRLVYLYGGKDVVVLDAAKGTKVWRASPQGEPWLKELFVAAHGESIVARTQSGARYGVVVLDAKQGAERWHDDGQGAVRNNAKPPAVVVSNLVERDGVHLGEETLYTLRETNGRTALWAQDLAVGTQRWRWSMPVGARGFTVIETPTAVLVPNSGMISSRLQLDVLDWGTGRSRGTTRLTGRQLVGARALVTGGTLVLSGEKGIFGFGRRDDERVAREAVELARSVARQPTNARDRARLASRLSRQGRIDEALELLQSGLLAEGLKAKAFDRLFAQMSSLRELHAEKNPLSLAIRRLPRPPEIDGELNDWWRSWTSVDMSSPRYVIPVQQRPGTTPGRWSGREDLSAKLYLGYDETYFYFALDVKDLHLRPYDSEAERWIGDCLLIAIDCRNDGGEGARSDDVLLSLALTLPKKKKDNEEDEEKDEEANKKKPDGRYFVHRKEDKSGAIYEVAIPWSLLAKNGATLNPAQGPKKGFTFGLNVILTDDDGDRAEKADPDDSAQDKGARGALKALELTPGVLLHHDKSRLWKGYIPKRFAKVRVE